MRNTVTHRASAQLWEINRPAGWNNAKRGQLRAYARWYRRITTREFCISPSRVRFRIPRDPAKAGSGQKFETRRWELDIYTIDWYRRHTEVALLRMRVWALPATLYALSGLYNAGCTYTHVSLRMFVDDFLDMSGKNCNNGFQMEELIVILMKFFEHLLLRFGKILYISLDQVWTYWSCIVDIRVDFYFHDAQWKIIIIVPTNARRWFDPTDLRI